VQLAALAQGVRGYGRVREQAVQHMLREAKQLQGTPQAQTS
jgi:hypothetical protein